MSSADDGRLACGLTMDEVLAEVKAEDQHRQAAHDEARFGEYMRSSFGVEPPPSATPRISGDRPPSETPENPNLHGGVRAPVAPSPDEIAFEAYMSNFPGRS